MSCSGMMGRYLIMLLLSCVSFLMIAKLCRAEHPDVLAELPNQPMIFNSPEELRTYLQELDKYFAIVGRPSGKRNETGCSDRSKEKILAKTLQRIQKAPEILSRFGRTPGMSYTRGLLPFFRANGLPSGF